ncbi:MAG: hypothetical protein HC770_08640, partial [Pseudanabaena sp. CRU_2_10]|nr:hypothetical protein [Pseudanabaena sp. CRU_2_10]
MNQQPQPPDPERVQQWAAKNQKIIERADANILILDRIIAELEADIRKQPMYQYRLKKAKQLLNIDVAEVSGSNEL